MHQPRRGYQGKYRFRLHDRENECSIELTTDEVQVAFLRIENDNKRCEACKYRKEHKEVS